MTKKPAKPSPAKPKKTGAHGKPAETISSGKAELTDEELTKVSGGVHPGQIVYGAPQ